MAAARFRSCDATGDTGPETARGGHPLDGRETVGEASTSSSDEVATSGLRLDVETIAAAREFMHRLSASDPVIEGVLFGSRARGDDRPDSDADVAVVLSGDGGERYRIAGRMAEIAFDVLLETGIMIDPLPLWRGELVRPEAFCNPALLAAIARDGVRI